MALELCRGKTKYLSIIVTESCNLNCVYCYEKHKTPRKGDFQTIINFIDCEDNKDDEFDHIMVDFFGGEPFVNFELIKRVVEYYKKKHPKKKMHFFATTNGTLVHGKIKQWLKNNANYFTCGLSLDGDRDSQNYNRSNSFDLIDLDFFASLYKGQHIKMTISPYSLKNLANDVIFCNQNGFDVSCNFAYGFNWEEKRCLDEIEKQLNILSKFYITNPQYRPCDMLNGSIKICKKDDKYARRWCGATTNSMTTLGVDGKTYYCQQLLPITSEKGSGMPKIPDLIDKNLLPFNCAKCRLVDICPTCYSSNFVNYGNPYIKDPGSCQIQQTILKCRAQFLINMWDNGLLKLKPEDEKALLIQYKEIKDYLNF